MNSLSLRSKSLLYSVSVHLAIAFVVVALMYKAQESSCACGSTMTMTKINLASLPLEQIPEQFDDVSQEKKTVSKPQKKLEKEIKKVVKPKEPALKQVELKDIQKAPVVAKKVEELEKPEEPKQETAKETVEKKVKETMVARTNAQKNASAVASENDLKIACEKQYVQDNIALINALIKQNLYYPRIAKKRGMQGKAMVAFTLNTEGEIIDIKALGGIASILSKAAVKTIQKAAESFPHPKVDLSLQIPIVYKLAQR